MIIKAVSLFLIAMLVLAMFGKLRLPGGGGAGGNPGAGERRRTKGLEARKCPDCGSYVIGPGPCPCKTASKKK